MKDLLVFFAFVLLISPHHALVPVQQNQQRMHDKVLSTVKPNPSRGETSVFAPGIRDRVHLVEELSEVIPLPKAKSHDANPWKKVLEMEQAHAHWKELLTRDPSSSPGTVEELREELRKLNLKRDEEVVHLQEKLFYLYFIAQDLFGRELEFNHEVATLKEERKSLKSLGARFFKVLWEKIAHPVERLFLKSEEF